MMSNHLTFAGLMVGGDQHRSAADVPPPWSIDEYGAGSFFSSYRVVTKPFCTTVDARKHNAG
jgi:hypothetical protein